MDFVERKEEDNDGEDEEQATEEKTGRIKGKGETMERPIEAAPRR